MATNSPDEWLICHQGPPRLGDTLHAWLTQDWFFDSVRWQTEAEWKARGHFRPKPW